MRPIDADAISYVQSESGCQDDYALRYDINELPTIDPIHAMGGCYCRECRYSSYDAEYNKRWCNRNGCHEVKTDGSGHCDLSEPREAQDDAD